MEKILKYFPEISQIQKTQFSELKELYTFWNEQINVISRKDIDHLYERHVLHSLSIARIIQFKKAHILDIGTGGGFPGIPLSILFPDSHFHLVDSIGKKITVVNEISQALQIKNVSTEKARVETLKSKYDFVISRAVTAFPKFVSLCKNVISVNSKHHLLNGIIYLKGGDFTDELLQYKNRIKVFEISEFFEEEFFETKKIIYLPNQNK